MTKAKQHELLDTVTHMADRGLRTLCLAYRDWEGSATSLPTDAPDEDLTAYAIVGIKVQHILQLCRSLHMLEHGLRQLPGFV